MPEHPSNGPLDRIRFFSLRCPSTLEARIMPPRLPNKLHAVALTSSASSSAPRSPANHTIPTSVTQENGQDCRLFPKTFLRLKSYVSKFHRKFLGQPNIFHPLFICVHYYIPFCRKQRGISNVNARNDFAIEWGVPDTPIPLLSRALAFGFPFT